SGDISALSNANWSNQDAVAAHKHSVFDDGFVLVHAVVVTGDGSRADIHLLSDLSVSQIGQMVCFRALAKTRLLQFNEIADVGVFANLAPRAHMAVRTERGAGPDHGMFQHAAGLDQHVVSYFAA